MTHQQLEKALRDLLMERSLYTEQAAAAVLGLCRVCHRDSTDPCSACQDGAEEDRYYREMMNDREDC